MNNFYLYGARSEDERYYQRFEADYANAGNNLISDIKDKSQEIEGHNQLLLRMEQGINNSKLIAEKQIEAFGFGGKMQEFCDKFNVMINNFEILSYRLLELYANNTAYDLLEIANPVSGRKDPITKGRKKVTRVRTLKETFSEVAGEEKISKVLRGMENDVEISAEKLFNSIYNLIDKPDKEMKKYLDDLIGSRKKDLSRVISAKGKEDKRNFQYRPDFGGKLGELDAFTFSRGLAAVSNEFINGLTSNKGVKSSDIKIVGSAGNKIDLLFGTLGFSIKNYTAIRERFIKGEGKKSKAFPDIKIHSSGFLGTVLENFAKDANGGIFSEDNTAEYFTFIMNAIYFKEYGEDAYYDVAKQALDLLVNAYAYVFLVQGTAGEKLGYSFLNPDEIKDIVLPGFIWLVGRGIVPMYRILIEIADNFKKILNKTIGSNSSGVYNFIKISNQNEAISKVDFTRMNETYPDNTMSRNGSYYTRSMCYPRLRNPHNVLTKRYKDFAGTVKTSVKLNMQLSSLERVMTNYSGTRTNV